jgi:hypothetical protein
MFHFNNYTHNNKKKPIQNQKFILPTEHICRKTSYKNSPCSSLIPRKSSCDIWSNRRPSKSWKLSTKLHVVSPSILYSFATYSNQSASSTDVQLLGCSVAQRGREARVGLGLEFYNQILGFHSVFGWYMLIINCIFTQAFSE